MKKLTINLRDETYKLIKENKINIRRKRKIIEICLDEIFFQLNQLDPKTIIEVGIRITEYEK